MTKTFFEKVLPRLIALEIPVAGRFDQIAALAAAAEAQSWSEDRFVSAMLVDTAANDRNYAHATRQRERDEFWARHGAEIAGEGLHSTKLRKQLNALSDAVIAEQPEEPTGGPIATREQRDAARRELESLQTDLARAEERRAITFAEHPDDPAATKFRELIEVANAEVQE